MEPVKPTLQPIEQMLDQLNVKAVFGEPVAQGESIIIPVAEVKYMFGYGSGWGEGQGPKAEDQPTPPGGQGGGTGGGGGGTAKPQGFIRLGADGVHYEGIMDLNRISLAGVLLSAWSIFWIMATARAFARRSGTCGKPGCCRK